MISTKAIMDPATNNCKGMLKFAMTVLFVCYIENNERNADVSSQVCGRI